MPSTFVIPEPDTVSRSDAMRTAAQFVHFLSAINRRSYSAFDSRRLVDYWDSSDQTDRGRFDEIVERISGYTIHWCERCDNPNWRGSWYGPANPFGDICQSCADELYWCDDCEQWSDYPHEHDDDDDANFSCCSVPEPEFSFPAPGADHETIANDRQFPVTSAGGVISADGMGEVYNYLSRTNRHPQLWDLIYGEDSTVYVGPEWTTKAGNFPKRVAKRYLQAGLKLSTEQLAEIGNIARRHTSSGETYMVAFTRDLNAPASEFLHNGSCWWTSESQSRCLLKQYGGLAMRTWSVGESTRLSTTSCQCESCVRDATRVPVAAGRLRSRAWVLPLAQSGELPLCATSDALTADVFVLFNAYGLDGYEQARLLAQITGKSYRKIEFRFGNAYINNGNGFLIASPQRCQCTNGVLLTAHRECRCT